MLRIGNFYYMQVFKATVGSSIPLRVYFIVAPASADEQRFLSAIKKERVAFERLISEKAHMSVPIPRTRENSGASSAVATIRKGSGVDPWGISPPGMGNSGMSSTQGALTTLLGSKGLSRYQLLTKAESAPRPLTVDLAGVADMGKRVVVVDLREFRAKLPFRLYNAGRFLTCGGSPA